MDLSPFVRRFLRRIQNTAHTFELWSDADAFVVGVSGGPDSLCLLDVLSLLRHKHRFTLHIAHVNYHLRGKGSTLDEALVRRAAKKYGFPFARLAAKKQTSASEETLRDIRYAFFESLRAKTKSQHIAVAHNQDDQAETLLLRLLRGAGLSGLSAMRPKNNTVIRPLIEISRKDILQYLKERGISYRTDKSNADSRYLRNKIRHELIPYLEKNYQPKIRKRLAETASLLGEDYALLSSLPTQFSPSENALEIVFSSKALLKLPLALIRQELRALIRPLFSGKNPDKNLVDELIKAIKSTKNKRQILMFHGLKFIRKGDIVRLLNF